jgi:hypothetical protein
MADLSDPESWRSSHGYDTESESVLVDESHYDSNDPNNLLDTDDDEHDADTDDSESDGGLFVPPHSPSPGPSVISLLSASDSGPDDGEIYHQLYFGNIGAPSEEDLAREELQRELEEIIPELRGHVSDTGLGLPQLHPRWSEDINEEDEEDEDEPLDLFGDDDFDGTDDDGFEEAFAEAFEDDNEDEEGVNGAGLHLPLPHLPSHHHHPFHRLFHHPRLPTVHPDIVLGVNPLQHLGPRLNFLPPHLHEHLQRASLSPSLPPLHRARMDRPTRSRNAGQARQRDELINVELANGSGSGSGGGRNLRGRSQNQQQRAAAPDVIDLTGDDVGEDNVDVDVEVVIGGSQNVRRQQSQRRENALRLNRSDSNYMGHQPQPPVIDISSDSEDDPLQARPALSLPNPANNNNHNHNHNHARHHHHRHVHHHHHLPRPQHHHHWPPMDGGVTRRVPGANNARGINNARGDVNPRGVFGQLIDAVFSGIGVNANRGRDDDVVMIGPGPANFPQMPVPVPNLGPIQFNYAAQPFNPGAPAAGPQKPPHEPPPKARDGFTRDTGEDQIVICPSCNEELAYDPDDEDENGPPTKKARTKKDRAEHHFWAVKDCGHVSILACLLLPCTNALPP